MALMNSFYGGRRGASFVIVKNYLDVVTMTADFARGNDFTEVNYDEYVMINNPNKNHPDNGKIFRRGYDYNSDRTLSDVTVLCDDNDVPYPAEQISEEKYNKKEKSLKFKKVEDINNYSLKAGGAEYIGCIVGPSGKAPMLKLVSYNEAEQKHAETEFDEYKGSGSYNPIAGFIPGKNGGNDTFNDSIQWYCTCIRNNNYGDDSQAYIGFKFPYLVTEMQTSWVEPYNENGNKYQNDTIFSVDRVDDKSHPYYNKWHLNIPKGIKGDTFSNLKVTTYHDWLTSLLDSDSRIMYNSDSSIYNPEEKDTNRQILVYEAINYDNKRAGQKKYYYLGDYNQVEDITYDEVNGKIIFSFTNQDDKKITFKQIQDIQPGMLEWDTQQGQWGNVISGTEGRLKIIYNNNTTKEFNFPWVKNIIYDENEGQLKYVVAGEGVSYPILTFKGITDIKQTTNEMGEKFITIQYTNNESQSFPIRMVSNINMRKDYTTENQQGQTQNYPACLVVTYNDNTSEVIATNFDYLKSFNYEEETGVLSFKLFSDSDDTGHTATLNYVKSIKYDKNNGKLTYILQNGEAKTINANDGEDSIPFIKQIELDSNLNLYVQMSSAGSINVPQSQENYPDAQYHSPSEGWYFLGNIIKEGNFSLMNSTSFKYYSWEEYQTEILESDAINTEYTTTTPSSIAEALTAKNLIPESQGISNQIIAVGLPNSSKYFFGYDSDNNRWFYMTGLESAHNVRIEPYNTILNPGSGDVLLGTRTDICTITTENVSISPSLHYFQTGKPLTLKVTSVLNSNQNISVSINGTDNGSLYTYDSGIITIPNVTGDINITKITI